jgi:hypothetical protein
MRYLEGQRNLMRATDLAWAVEASLGDHSSRRVRRHTSRTSRIRKMDALRGSALASILKNLAMALTVHFEMSLAEGCNV